MKRNTCRSRWKRLEKIDAKRCAKVRNFKANDLWNWKEKKILGTINWICWKIFVEYLQRTLRQVLLLTCQKYFVDWVRYGDEVTFTRAIRRRRKKSSFSLPINCHILSFLNLPSSLVNATNRQQKRENNETISTFDRDRSTRNYPR